MSSETSKDPPWRLDGELVLAVSSAESYKSTVCKVVEAATRSSGQGIILTANRPHATLMRSLEEAGVAMDGIRFLDCITPVANMGRPSTKGAVYVDSPTLLETMVLRLEQLHRRMGDGDHFLIVDSLSALSVYNGEDAVTEMVHNLVSRLRMRNMSAAFIAVDSQNTPDFMETVTNYCDRAITYEDGSL